MNVDTSPSRPNLTFSTLLDLLEFRAQSDPKMKAYTFLENGEIEHGHLTNAALDRQARAIGGQLQELEAFGQRVLLLYPTSLEFIAAFFGCLYAGAIAVPIYPPRAKENLSRIQQVVTDAQITLALTNNALWTKITSQLEKSSKLEKVRLVNTDEIDPQASFRWRKPLVNAEDLALIQYTSGSTGSPKGVMVTHGNLLHNQKMIKKATGFTEGSISVGWLPQFHDLGLIGQVLQPLFSGFPHIFMSPVAFLQKPIRWLNMISHFKATTSGGPNFAYDLCVRKISPEQRMNLDLTSWQIAFVGAEPVRAETLDRFSKTFEPCGFRRKALYPCYGLAEATLFVSGGIPSVPPIIQNIESTALRYNQVEMPQYSQRRTRDFVGCGRTWLDQKILIVDPETLRPCPTERVGEIWASGASIAQGYWNQPEKSTHTFRAYLSDTGKGPFLRTGDLGFMRDHELFVTGRLKDLIIIGGQNHYPQDIESTAQESHAALRAGCGGAFAVDHEGEERLVIVQEIEPRHLRTVEAQEVISAIQQAVSEQHGIQVHAVVLLKPASIDKTSSGKIRRHVCRLRFLEGNMNVVSQWPEKSLVQNWEPKPEKTVINISSEHPEPLTQEIIQDWLVDRLSAYLKVPPHNIDIRVPTAEYGLDSSVAVSLTGQISIWLGLELEPTLFWEFPSIESLAAHLNKELKNYQPTGQNMSDSGN